MEQRKWLALCGIVAAILFPLAIVVISGNTPNQDASAAKVLSFYRAHDSANKVAAVLVLIAVALLVLFAAQLRSVLDGDGPGAGVLPLAAFGGLLVSAAGFSGGAAIHLALVAAADNRFVSSAQTLNVLDNFAAVAILAGFVVFGLAAGFTVLRRRVVPRWLGWAAIVFGVISVLGPVGILGVALGLIWIIVVGVMLFRRDLVPAAA